MTLDNVVTRLQKPPAPGSHEIVRGPDGLHHLVIITMVRDITDRGGRVREYAFHSWCNHGGLKANELEVVENITCILCIQWRST